MSSSSENVTPLSRRCRHALLTAGEGPAVSDADTRPPPGDGNAAPALARPLDVRSLGGGARAVGPVSPGASSGTPSASPAARCMRQRLGGAHPARRGHPRVRDPKRGHRHACQ